MFGNNHLSVWRHRAARLATGNQRALVGGILTIAVAFWFVMGASLLYAHQLFDGLP